MDGGGVITCMLHFAFISAEFLFCALKTESDVILILIILIIIIINLSEYHAQGLSIHQ